ncbi:glutathione S-transferase [Methylobacterium sp. Leaf93]|uniref:glutathione S-transferase n=1 Tax=Methylobacterium sp. Leaf93 TaxID=1736249 RepID=UPI0006FF2470|nr:glutathione S-transferase [Methylobacterium sp. Leaf93]KQP05703.1 glutathione S-transferase [Methylobacterium sp. Leaf93]
MQLIGMLDSPYVRRVAISLKLMGIPFVHRPLSVFRHYEAFAAINPVVKAPTLVTDNDIVLMDSTLILDHAECLIGADRRLHPITPSERDRSQRLIALALAACEKTVQIVYERNLRPAEKQHGPWIDRVRGQLVAAYDLIEDEIGDGEGWLLSSPRPLQADVSVAVAWSFSRMMIPDLVDAGVYPRLVASTARAEALPEFLDTPAT